MCQEIFVFQEQASMGRPAIEVLHLSQEYVNNLEKFVKLYPDLFTGWELWMWNTVFNLDMMQSHMSSPPHKELLFHCCLR